jgi:hypothetical protein
MGNFPPYEFTQLLRALREGAEEALSLYSRFARRWLYRALEQSAALLNRRRFSLLAVTGWAPKPRQFKKISRLPIQDMPS